MACSWPAPQSGSLWVCLSGIASALAAGTSQLVFLLHPPTQAPPSPWRSCDALRQPLEDMFYAELLWVDKAGVYLQAVDQSGASEVLRLPFMRPVEDERDARSQLTILAQQAWERERTWNPLLATVNLGVDEVLPSQLASQLVVDNNNN